MKGLRAIILCMLALVGLALSTGCGQPATEGAAAAELTLPAEANEAGEMPANTTAGTPDVVALVNGQPIQRVEYERQVARFQAAMVSQGYSFSGEEGRDLSQQVSRQVLEAMIDQLLIEQEAEKAGVSVSEEVLNQRIQNDVAASGGEEAFNQWLSRNGMTMEEYREMTRSTILSEEMVRRLSNQLPDTMAQIHLRQILVATEEEAAHLRTQLDAGADFAELARQHSLDLSTRDQGGDMGFIPLGEGVLQPEVEAAVRDLPAGAIAGPIPSPYGYYLVKVEEPASQQALAPEVRQGLTHSHFMKWIEELRAASDIQYLIQFDAG